MWLTGHLSVPLCILFAANLCQLAFANLNVWVNKEMIAEIFRNFYSNQDFSTRHCPQGSDQMERMAGFIDRLSLIKDGSRMQFVHFNISKQILPPTIKQVFVMWQSNTKHEYSLKVRQRGTSFMYKPMLSVPETGFVPRTPSRLTLSLPCTGLNTGTTPIEIFLNITEVASHRSLRNPPALIKGTVFKKCLSEKDSRRMERIIFRCGCKQKCRLKRHRRCCVQKCVSRRYPKKKGKKNRKRCRKRRRKGRKGKGNKKKRKRDRKNKNQPLVLPEPA